MAAKREQYREDVHLETWLTMRSAERDQLSGQDDEMREYILEYCKASEHVL